MGFLQDVGAAIGRASGTALSAPADPVDREQVSVGLYGLPTSVAWRLAGLLFIGSALIMVPANPLLGKSLEASVVTLGALAGGPGSFCLAASRRQLSRRWLAVVPVVAVAEMA